MKKYTDRKEINILKKRSSLNEKIKEIYIKSLIFEKALLEKA